MKRLLVIVILLWILFANFEIVEQKPIDIALYCMEYGNKQRILVDYNREIGCFKKGTDIVLNKKVEKYYGITEKAME